MTQVLFRVALPDGSTRLARGSVDAGPAELLATDITIESILQAGANGLATAVRDSAGAGPVPPGSQILAPIDVQEVWAAPVFVVK